MAMTQYNGDPEVISKLGTTPQERGLTTEQFKAKFDEGLKAFVTWFNDTHKTEFDAHLADNTSAHGINLKANKSWGTIYTATLQNGWSGTLEYSKNDLGQVWLRGAIVAGTVSASLTIASLPVGYRVIQTTPISAHNYTNSKSLNGNFYAQAYEGIFGLRDITGIATGDSIRFNTILQV